MKKIKIAQNYLTRKFEQLTNGRQSSRFCKDKFFLFLIKIVSSVCGLFLRPLKFPSLAVSVFVFALYSVFIGSSAFSAPKTLTYQGRILKSDGTPLIYNNVSFIFQILSPDASCVIFQEAVTGKDMSNSAGIFDMPIGAGTLSFPLTAGTSVIDTFNNLPDSPFACGTCSGYTCTNGASIYAPAAADGRLLRVKFFDGSDWLTITPDSAIRSVPYAGFATSAQKLGSYAANDFLIKAGLPNCANGTFLTWNGTSLTCSGVVGAAGGTVTGVSGTSPLSVATGTSTPVISLANGTAAGQVHRWDGTSAWVSTKLRYTDLVNATAGSPWPSVSCVSGEAVVWSSATDSFSCTALAVATTQLTGTLSALQMPAFSGDVISSAGTTIIALANSGVTPGTYSKVTVDAKGRVTVGANIGSSEVTTALGYTPVNRAGDSMTGTFGLAPFASDPSTAGWDNTQKGYTWFNTTINQIKYWDGSAIQALGVSGVGLTGLNGLSGSTQAFAIGTAGTDFNISSATNTHTFNFPNASGTVRGLLTSADWATFNSKQSSSLPSAQIFVGNGSNVATGVAISGDATITNAGALTVTGTLGKNVTTAPTLSGQVLRYDGTNLVPSFISMFDLRSTVTGASTFGSGSAGCTAGQTLTWTAATDNLSCTNIAVSSLQVSGLAASATTDTTNANNISSGTLNSARLPAASGTADGIVNQVAQSFAGVKTFVNNLIAQGTLTVTGLLTANGGFSTTTVSATGNISTSADLSSTNVTASGAGTFDRIKVANSNAPCDGSIEGSLRYNSTSKKMEYCNGTSWTNISSGTQANLSIGSPSSSIVKSGPVTFTVTYGSGVDAATITLATANITLGGTDSTGCSVTGVTGSGSTRTVTVNGCTGTGTVNISIAANTASSTTGDAAPAAGPSTTYQVDNTGPTIPTGVTLGSVPNNLTNTPTITYTAASDAGGSTVANHQVQIIKTSDSSVAYAWANHTSGSDVAGLSLATSTQYSVLVRAVDALGNIGIASTAVNWTTTANPCPSNFILVPALAGYTASEFCVAKYEMRNNGSNVAISQSTGTPWVSVARGTDGTTAGGAWKACKDMGANYDLISNAQWQTIARNIADVTSNWSSGTAYSGELNRGHSDNGPANALAAAADSDPCNGTGQTCSTSTWDSQRRTHNLSNGNVIWDFAGNVWEWVQDNNSSAQGTDGYSSTFNSGSLQTNYSNDSFCGSPSASPYCGFGRGWVNYSAGAVGRGGARDNVVDAGVFASDLSTGPTNNTFTVLGFRCVYQP